MVDIENCGVDMKIYRKLVLKIIRYLIDNPKFYFPFFIKCKGLDGSDEYIEVIAQEDDYEMIINSDDYIDFILVENLQHLHKETVELMSKGFIEQILKEPAINKIRKMAEEARKTWNITLCESENIEVYGSNEYIGGKADAYEEVLNIITDFN